MSNWGQIREIVDRTLSDGREHTYVELKEAIIAENEAVLTSSNTLSAVLYQMMKSDKRLIRTGKAVYQYVESSDGMTAAETAKSEDAILGRLRGLLLELDKQLEKPNYEMSEEEFAEKKKLYQLSKKLHKVVDAYL